METVLLLLCDISVASQEVARPRLAVWLDILSRRSLLARERCAPISCQEQQPPADEAARLEDRIAVHDGFDIVVFVFATLSRLHVCGVRGPSPMLHPKLTHRGAFRGNGVHSLSGETTAHGRNGQHCHDCRRSHLRSRRWSRSQSLASSTVGGPHCCHDVFDIVVSV